MKHEPIIRTGRATEAQQLREILRGILHRIALAEQDPADRQDKIDILKKDGWL